MNYAKYTALFDGFELSRCYLGQQSWSGRTGRDRDKLFEAMRLLKARAAASGAMTLPALGRRLRSRGTCQPDGAPGIWLPAGRALDGDFGTAMARVHDELTQVNAEAISVGSFCCALAPVRPDGDEV